MFLLLTFNIFTPFSSVSIIDVEQVNVSWEYVFVYWIASANTSMTIINMKCYFFLHQVEEYNVLLVSGFLSEMKEEVKLFNVIPIDSIAKSFNAVPYCLAKSNHLLSLSNRFIRSNASYLMV